MTQTLVDSSICIDYLRQKLTPEIDASISDLFRRNAIAVNHLIWVELYCGIRSKREELELSNFLNDVTILETDKQCWEETARISRRCKRSGVNVPLSDIQIQACADRYKLELFHNDKHFNLIQSTA